MMDTFGWNLFTFIIFPGFLFTAVIGLISSWIERKVTARVQWRKGPPLGQPIYDILKLFGKETILPDTGNSFVFLFVPFTGLIAVTLVSAILWTANLQGTIFIGDVIVVTYLLMIPSLAIMIGGMVSGNPYAVTGANREMKLMLSYELPILVCLVTVILKSNLSIKLHEIAASSVSLSISGALALVVSLICIQAKLGFPPFDIAEAETEIMEGPFIEYSGTPLAIFKLTHHMLLITLPVYLSTLFLGGLNFSGLGILYSILKIIIILVLVIVIKNTNPRLRIDQAVKLFWRVLTPIASASFLLALFGRMYGVTWL